MPFTVCINGKIFTKHTVSIYRPLSTIYRFVWYIRHSS